MTIPLSSWSNIRPEFQRKKRIMEARIMAIRQQELAKQNAGKRFYGDNL